MEEPIFPRTPWKDPVALRQRMERAAQTVQKDEAKALNLWITLGFALAVAVISGCSPAPTPPYGAAPPLTQSASPSPPVGTTTPTPN